MITSRKIVIATCAAFVFLQPSVSSAGGDDPLHPSYHRHPQTDVGTNRVPVIQNATLNQTAIINQNVVIKPVILNTIVQKPTTNAGNIDNRSQADGGDVNIAKGALSPSAEVNFATGAVKGGAGGNAYAIIQKDAVNNQVEATGGSVNNSGNSKIVDSGNSTVNVTVAAPQKPETVRAIATTPTSTALSFVAPQSFYSAGVPIDVLSDKWGQVVDLHCSMQVSGEKNTIYDERRSVYIIATLDDQVKSLGTDRGLTPKVDIISVNPLSNTKSGKCLCIGTVVIKSSTDPDKARWNTRQSMLAELAQWLARNIRGFKGLKVVPLVAYDKITAAQVGSLGIGAGVSMAFTSGIAMAAPSIGKSSGISHDVPAIQIFAIVLGTIDGEDAPPGARTADFASLMSDIAGLPNVSSWGNSAVVHSEASQVK